MMRAIVVDDERRTRETLIHHLRWESLGFDTVVQAEDGVAALELANQSEPDLILTDIMMPRMNGIQLASEIRELYPRCKLIFLSAYSEKNMLKSAIQLQVVDYVEKPLDLTEIEQVIQRTASVLMEEKKIMRRFFANQQGLRHSEERNGARFNFDKQLPDQLFKLLQNKDKEQAHALVKQFIASLDGCDTSEISNIRNAFYSIIVRLEPDAESPEQYIWELVASMPTISHFQQYIEQLIDRTIEQWNKPNDTAADILDYIRDNLQDHNLGVSSIAQHLFLTPSHICSVFKKSTSRSIHYYITSERMKLAKRYLQDPAILMQEVASKVGYHDPKYFTKVFKKEAGITPSEYRKKVMR